MQCGAAGSCCIVVMQQYARFGSATEVSGVSSEVCESLHYKQVCVVFYTKKFVDSDLDHTCVQ